MKDDQSSTTALGATTIRAVHQLIDEVPHILEDSVSVLLLSGDAVREIQNHPKEHRSPQARGLRSHVVLRSRYAEDALHQAVESGITQFLSLGAGYDTFSARQPDWARVLKIVEIDHPATQAAKIEHFKRAGISFPSSVEFLPLDLESGDLRASLAATALDPSKPIFVSCLGVLAYLRPATVRKVFDGVAGMSKGSRFVFAFAPDDAESSNEPRAYPSTAERAAKRGEVWLTRFDLGGLRQQLLKCGFGEVVFLEPEIVAERYYKGRTDLPPPRRARICSAKV